MKKILLALTVLQLPWNPLPAQTAVSNSAGTVVYTKPSAADIYEAANPGAVIETVGSGTLTFRRPDGSHAVVVGNGVSYQQNGQWLPSKLQITAAADGSGWSLVGVPINVTLVGSTAVNRNLTLTFGSTELHLRVPQLVHNGDDTFTFQENGTAWVLRVAEASVHMQATVANRTGKATHAFGYTVSGSTIASTAVGTINVGTALHVSPPGIIGADRKTYGLCSAWSTDGNGLSFSCDDTKLPASAFPYVIDPVFTSGPTDGYISDTMTDQQCCDDTEFDDRSSAQVIATFDTSSIPSNAQITDVGVTGDYDSSFSPMTDWGTSPNTWCNVMGSGWADLSGGHDMQSLVGGAFTWNFKFELGGYKDGTFYGCSGGFSGTNLVGTVTYTLPTPNITSLSPTSGPIGTSVTIAGTNFGAAKGNSTVTFNGTTATPGPWNATSIQVPVPIGATTGPVIVTVGGVSSNGPTFTVTVLPPVISVSIAPSSLLTGASATVTVALSAAAPTGGAAVSVSSNNTMAFPNSVCTVAAGQTSGSCTVTAGSVSVFTGVTLTASYGGGTPTTTVTVTPISTAGYSYSRAITISHLKVPNTDQTAFPVLISGTYSFLASVANGGRIQNANGFDIIFTADAAGATPLPWEIEKYSAADGTVAFWVRVPTVSHSVDTTIYMFYGNPSVTTFQSAANAVWDGNFRGVWHFSGSTSPSTTDSTANGNMGSNSGATATGGQIGNGASFSTGQHISLPFNSSLQPAQITVSCWCRASSSSSGYQYAVDSNSDSSGVTLQFAPSDGGYYVTLGNVLFNRYSSKKFNGGLHHLTMTYDGSLVRTYVDGVLDINQSISGSPGIQWPSHGTNLGSSYGLANQYTGLIDELRWSSAARSSDWIATEYNNEGSPTTFYSVGSELAGTGPTTTVTSVSITPSSVVSGASASVTVTLSAAAPTGGAAVTLSSNNTTAFPNATCTVAVGQTSEGCTVTAGSVGSSTVVTVTASYGGANPTTTVTVTPPTVVSVSITPSSVASGANASVTVNLSAAAPIGGAAVTLSSNNTTAFPNATCTVTAGQTTRACTVTAGSVGSSTVVTVTASYGGSNPTTTVTVTPPTVVSVSITPSSVASGANASVTVNLSAAAPTGGAAVTLSSNNTTAFPNATCTVTAGQTTRACTVTAGSVGSSTVVTVTASYGGANPTTTVIVNPPAPTLISVSPASGLQGSAYSVTLGGTNFTAGSAVSVDNSGIALSNVSVVNSTQITVIFTISSSAALGNAHVTVTTAGGTTTPQTFTVNGISDLTITSTHSGNFALGQTGATYTLTVSNVGTVPSSGLITATDTLPSGLSASGMSGTGWTCILTTLTCTRSDALATGTGYPILLTLNVASNAPALVTNNASISGGGELNLSNDTASDPTAISPSETVSTPSVPTGSNQSAVGVTYSFTASGASSSLGYAVQYQFNWGDGVSGWLPASTNGTHAWTTPGNYQVTLQARSTANNAIVSQISSALQVAVQGFSFFQYQDYFQTPAGTNLTVPVTTICGNGFTGGINYINFSDTGYFFNGNPIFDPFPTPCGTPATMTLIIGPYAAPGAYQGTLTASATIFGQIVTQTIVYPIMVTTQQASGLAASPPTQTITQGQTATYSVGIMIINGFNGTVALSCNSSSSSLCPSVSFSPSSINGSSGNSTMTVHTTSATPAGNYAIQILGNSPGQQEVSTSVYLTVQSSSPQSFTLISTPSSAPTFPGGNAQYTITVSTTNGFNGNIGLACSGLPTGIKESFSTNQITSAENYTSLLNLSVDPSVEPGTVATCNLTGTSGSLTSTIPVQVTVTPLLLSVVTTSLPSGILGSGYSFQAAASGGTSPYSWSATGLPSGLLINSLGLISGTPTSSGTSTVILTAIDSTTPTHQTAMSGSLPLTIGTGALSIQTTLPTGTVGTAYTTQATASGGTLPYSWSATGLPAGLSISSVGLITGTPTTAGTSNVVLTVTDSATPTHQSATSTPTLTIASQPTGYTIAGHVTAQGVCPISSLIVTLTSGGNNTTTATDPTGAYSFTNLTPGGNYSVTPSNSVYTYGTSQQQFNSLSGNVSNADFTATGPVLPSREYIRVGGRVIAVANCGGK